MPGPLIVDLDGVLRVWDPRIIEVGLLGHHFTTVDRLRVFLDRQVPD